MGRRNEGVAGVVAGAAWTGTGRRTDARMIRRIRRCFIALRYRLSNRGGRRSKVLLGGVTANICEMAMSEGAVRIC